MSDPGEPQRFSTPSSPLPGATAAAGSFSLLPPATASEYPFEPLTNLSAVSSRMDTLHRFLSDSVNRNVLLGETQMQFVSTEISSAIHEVIVNGAALLASSPFYRTPTPNLPPPTNRNPNSCYRPPEIPNPNTSCRPAGFWNLTADRIPNEWVEDPKPEPVDLEPDELGGSNKINDDSGYEVVEVDAVELLAEHVHFCEFCGKGFKRDANLRMHMRAHGEQFKRPEALVKPPPPVSTSSSSGLAESANGGGTSTNTRKMRFSCPFVGCNRNKGHKKFRPLKSVICVRNHFKRTHCPKMYSCTRCNEKKFSVLGDLKNHMKNCGKSKWKCSCGTTFSRKDKLFGHMSSFEGHMPAIDDGGADGNDEKLKNSEVSMEEEAEEEEEFEAELGMMEEEVGGSVIANNKSSLDNNHVFEGLDSMDDRSLQEMWGSYSPEFYQQFCNF